MGSDDTGHDSDIRGGIGEVGDIGDRIRRWTADGVIDAATAERLRVYEHSTGAGRVPAPGPSTGLTGSAGAAASFFGPAVGIGEMFAYLGAIFLLGAWQAFVGPQVGDFGPPDAVRSLVQYGIPAAVLFIIGFAFPKEDPRLSRAAGVALGVATAYATYAIVTAITSTRPDVEFDVQVALFGGVATVLAAVSRRFHAAVLTQFTLLIALVTLAGGSLAVLQGQLFPRSAGVFEDDAPLDSTTAIIRLVGTAAWWLVWAIGIGAIARYEAWSAHRAARAGEPVAAAAAGRRAGLTRFFAGMVAVAGTASAMTQTNSGERVIPAWLGDLVILAVAIGLLVLAYRRNSSAYLVPAGIGFVTALTDANATYVASTAGTAAALLLEGLILLGAGVVTVAVRRAAPERPGSGRNSGTSVGLGAAGAAGPAESPAPLDTPRATG